MPDNGGYGRVAVAPSVGAQESIAEIDAHYAAAVADRPQLPVGQIARLRAQGVGIRVGGHQWGGGMVGGIPKGLFIHVRNIDLHLQGVGLSDERNALASETRPAVRAAGKGAGDPAAEAIGDVPERTNAAHPGAIKGLQIFALRVEPASTFDVRHHRQRVILATAFDIRRAQAQPRATGVMGANRLEDSQLLPEDRPRIPRLAGVLRRHAGDILLRRHKEGEQAAGQPALADTRIVEMAVFYPGKEGAYRILTMVKPEIQQQVIVTIKNRHSGFLRS